MYKYLIIKQSLQGISLTVKSTMGSGMSSLGLNPDLGQYYYFFYRVRHL